ncbi:MAG: NTP transferase domain-containing protein, partial [Rubrivivax sp.]
MRQDPTVIVVAAGRGSRFAGPGHKLLQPLGDSTVLGQTLAHVIEAGMPMLVVLTPSLAIAAAQAVARRDLLVIPEADAARGMGHTIAARGQARPPPAGWVV